MTAILQILANPRPLSFSRRVAGEITGRIAAARPGTEIDHANTWIEQRLPELIGCRS